MGFRPSLPDSLPVLGFSSRSNRVLYAFGHQHLGMSLGAITGQLIADLVAGREPAVDMHPYRANRF
jgi:D-amino-acid dehydrogenase